MRVAAIDIGSFGKLGWAIDHPWACGDELEGCVNALVEALNQGPLALGFEAPQFVPLRDNQENLTKARCGEGARPFSAGAGAAVLVTSLVTVPYVLKGLREGVPEATVTFDWRQPPTKPRELLVYEAFVTNQQNNAPNRHVRDAKLAIAAFRLGIEDPQFESSVTVPTGFNLLGAALLRTGWSTDIGLLSAQCLVVAPAAVAG
jgi:hypothetical protein